MQDSLIWNRKLTAGEYKDLADCDLIVEAVLEKMEIKKFDPVVRKHVIYKEAKIK